MSTYNKDRVLEALKDKKINHLKKAYLKLDPILTNNQRASIKKKIKSSTPDGFSELLIGYFYMYNISYKNAPVRGERKPEDKEKVAKRQSDFVARQKSKNLQKIQVYLSQDDYQHLIAIKKIYNQTYSQIISSSLRIIPI